MQRFDEELEICSMFSEDYEEVRMQERISTAAARGCVERWLIQVCNHNVFIIHVNT